MLEPMNIFVFVKIVPHTESKIGVLPEGKGVDFSQVAEWVINPYDEYALEEALRIKERLGGSVTAITIGPEKIKAHLKNALGMGVEEAYHILSSVASLPRAAADSGYSVLQNAFLASRFLKKTTFDLILCGKMGIDYYLSSFPLALAQMLDIPCVSGITKLEIRNREAVAQREVEGGKEVVLTSLPAIFTCEKGLNEPRYPSLRLLMLAQKKEVPTYKAEELGGEEEISLPIEIVKTSLPPPRKPGRLIEGEIDFCVKELVRLLREEAKVI